MTQHTFPALDAAVAEFALASYPNCYAYQAGEPDDLPVAELTHPDNAQGNCDVVSEAFVAFLAERGLTGKVVFTEDATEWGYQGTTRHGQPCDYSCEHFAVVVGGWFVDWTASQFLGTTDFPVLRPA